MNKKVYMKINVSGNINLGQSFVTYVNDEFKKEESKYINSISVVDVSIKKQNEIISTNITINDAFKKGVKITAEAEERDIYKSFDEAFKKMMIQFLKEKDKNVTNKKKGTN